MVDPEKSFYLTSSVASAIAQAMEKGLTEVEVSPDLNLSQVIIPVKERRVVLGGQNFEAEELKEFARKESGILYCQNGEGTFLQICSDHFYKLKPTNFAPTVEIDGIRMHRTKDLDPWEDSRRKANYAVRPGDYVLDTCGGLGYTAIWSVKFGARKVLSIEKDIDIIELRKLNPHSQLFFAPTIQAEHCDINNYIQWLPNAEFDSIIHDPPRFSLAGELYGGELYGAMFRVLKEEGRLFHYTGDPYTKGRGRRFYAGVVERLHRAGFKVEPKLQDLGVFAKKIKPNFSLKKFA